MNRVILDMQGVEIKDVNLVDNGTLTSLSFDKSTPDQDIGSSLEIALPEAYDAGKEFTIRVNYTTGKDSKALNWVEANEQNGQDYPLMFTQCQPIDCRSFAPMQDTIAIKITYDATIITPEGMQAKMSASDLADDSSKKPSGKGIFKFNQKVPIPSYGIALVVGQLNQKKLGQKVNLITQSGHMFESQEDLGNLDRMLKDTEAYLTPYEWSDYNILFLPDSMPNNIAGMENPQLTIVSPQAITGSSSTVALHEIAHSWFGNLITCKTWGDFWLNEAFATFVERKMTQKILGDNQAQLSIFTGNAYLEKDLKELGDKNTFSSLKMNLAEGQNPSASQTNVQYEKGYQFLVYLEKLTGQNKFQQMLQSYIQKFKF